MTPPERGQQPIGLLALAGVVAAALLAGVLLVACGGDDGGSSGSASGSSSASGSGGADEGSGTGEFEVAFDDDRPAAAFPVDLQAGDALRVGVDGLDAAITIAADEEAQTDGFRGLVATDDADYDDHLADHLAPLAYDVLGVSGFDDIADVLDDGDHEAALEELADAVPELEGIGGAFYGTDRGSDDVEGAQLVAPSSGTYTVVVTGGLGEAGVVLEVEEGDDEGLDGDEIDHLDYVAHYAEHVDFFCDEGFFGGDPVDVTSYGPTICDPEVLEGALTGQFSGDFTNDFGGNLSE